MHVVLINPPHPYLIDPDSQAPMGLMCIASALRQNKQHTVTLANLSRFTVDEAITRIPIGADCYGITSTSLDYPLCCELTKKFKQINPAAIVILGGAHPTIDQLNIDKSIFDSIVVGEGEQVIHTIVNDIHNNKLARRYSAERLLNLDEYPYPARDLMDIVGGQIFSHNSRYAVGGSSVIISARGCPFACAFCASAAIWKRKVTLRSVESIVAEIKHVKEKYGVSEFRFSDDTINIDASRLRLLCSELSKLNVFWRCSMRAGISNKDTYKLMYDGGCREISPGVESGDQRVLDTLCKGTKVKDNANLISWATSAGINVRVLMMSGTPGEHPDTPEINRDFINSLEFNALAITQFRPLPGSKIWCFPKLFDCTILDTELANYNLYYWARGVDGSNQMAAIKSIIKTGTMSVEQLEDNMLRMRQYALASGRCNFA